MALSKKEISILIEVVFSILFALIFMPFFYENQGDNLISINNLIGFVIYYLHYIYRFNFGHFGCIFSYLQLLVPDMGVPTT